MDNQKYEEYAQKFQKALLAIRKLKKDLAEAKQNQPNKEEAIAIISTACRYPKGIETPQDFWNLLANAAETISEVPSQRWDIEDWYNAEKQIGKMTTKKGGFLENIDLFDNEFFGISPREALFIDPQHRLLLELACEAIERAGINLNSLNASNTGVYIGIVSNNDYAQKHFKSPDPKRMDTYSATGTGNYSASGRISYFLGMHGANMSIDTACSSSLVAIHTACKALQNGEIEAAIVGGSHAHPTPEMFVALSQMGALAPDGRSKAFDAEANGFSRGEGGAVFVLKKLSDAEKNGDKILGIIAASDVNHDGRSNGFAAPNSLAQEMLLRKVLENAGLTPEMVGFIETHGTGTKLGDPIEFSAIKNVFAQNRKKPLLLGAVKTNVGHTEGAAGITGVLKVLLSMQNKQIPQNLHFQKPNPFLDWDKKTIDVPRKLMDWEVEDKKRIAGVSSFGIAGTNAHLIIQEYSQNTDNQELNDKNSNLDLKSNSNSKKYLLPISAKSKESLLDYLKKYKAFLTTLSEFEKSESTSPTISTSSTVLNDICSFSAFYRTDYPQRICLVADTIEEMISELDTQIEDKLTSQKDFDLLDADAQIVFVFAGQGGQWLGMARKIYAKEPVFKQSIDNFDVACKEFVDFSIVEELHKAESENNFENIAIIQPVLLAVEIAFAELWKSFGVMPDAVLGHSMGEVAAAFVAGALTIWEAANVICTRSNLMTSQSNKGGMLVLGLPVEDCQKIIENTPQASQKVSIAVNNSPNSTVLSGDVEILQSICDEFEEQDVFCKMVNVGVASHSQQMEILLPELKEKLANLNPQNSEIPIYSSVRANQIEGSELTADYWADNLRKMVQFAKTTELILDDEYQIFIEMSPHAVLTAAIEQAIGVKKIQAYALSSTQRNTENPSQERQDFYQNLGTIYQMSDTLNWGNFYQKKVFKNYFDNPNWHNFPTYAWNKQSFWLDTPSFTTSNFGISNQKTKNSHPLLGVKLDLAGEKNLHTWNIYLNTQNTNYLAQHRIAGEAVFPASGYIEMILATISEIFENGNHVIRDLKFHKKLIIPNQENENNFAHIQLKIKSQNTGNQLVIGEELENKKVSQNLEFAFYVKDKNGIWELFADGKAQIHAPFANFRKYSKSQFDLESQDAEVKIDKDTHYQMTAKLGIDYGTVFQGVERIFYDENKAWVKIKVPREIQNQDKYLLHPAVLDACLQGSIQVLADDILEDLEHSTFISASIASLQLIAPLKKDCQELFVHIELVKVSENRRTFYFNIVISDGEKTLMRLFDVCVMKLDKIKIENSNYSENGISNTENSILSQVQNANSEEEQSQILTAYLQTQIAKITYNPVSKIDPKKSFKLLGLDSLMNVQLASHLSKSLTTKIPITSFQAYKNVEQYVEFLIGEIEKIALKTQNDYFLDETDLYKDCQLGPEIALNGLIYYPQSDWKNILLTGATGFSGAFMLRELIENTYANIHCLVRAKNKDLAFKRIEDNLKKQGIWKESYRTRIVPIAGDLARPKLGLLQEKFDELAQEIDVIFHIGFLVNWVYSYSDVRAANILGTKELFKLATQSKIKAVHFSSSIATFSSINLENGMHIEEKDILEDGEKLKVGYTQAKWVIEKLMREAQKRGLPFSIYRFGDVRGYSKTGVSNTTDFMSQFIKGCIKMKSAPDKGLYINMLPVDYLITSMFRVAANPSIKNTTFHFSNPQVISWTEFVNWMRDYGFELEIIPFEDWTKKLLNLAKENLNDETYRTLAPIFVPLRLDEETENTSFWDLLTRLNYVSLDMKNTQNALQHTTLSCPALLDEGLLKTYFDKYLESKFLSL